MFDKEAILQVLAAKRMVERPRNPIRGWRYVDGGVVDTLNAVGRAEYVHSPSLVQHTGAESVMDKGGMSDGKDPDFKKHTWKPGSIGFAESFRGEDFNLLTLLK